MVKGRPLLASVVAALLCLVSVAPAVGETTSEARSLSVRVEHVEAEPDGTTRMTVAVSGLDGDHQVTLEQLEVVENGEVVEDLRLAGQEELAQGAVVPAAVVAIDVSGSTVGEPLEAARGAALDLVADLGESGAPVGVVGFAEETETVAPLDTDTTRAVSGLQGLEGGGGTALYDGVARAARMLSSHDGPRDVIVFSDGEDTTSGTDLDGVRGLLAETDVRVTSVVLLGSEGVAVAPLQALAAVNGGTVIEVEDTADLAEAFAAVAGDLTNRLQIEWTAEPVPDPPRTLNVVATYRADEVAASDGLQLDSPRLAAVAPPQPVEPGQPLVPLLTGRSGLVTATVSGGVALLLLAFLILVGSGDRRRQAQLDDRLAAYRPRGEDRSADDRTSLSDRARSALEAIPRPANLDSRIAARIEQADWPLRVSEFILVSFGVSFLGLLVGAVLLGSLLLGVLTALAGFAAPWLYMRVAVTRRRKAFAEQLPTVLQVLAGALRAGHAFSTALEGAVDEVDEPAKGELRRASVEARLGRPMDRALEGVAQRMGSVDLQWVIGALEVQREVGGNLAEILSNVAATLRDRSSISRHVQSLTAEGRLSATFITAMPFVMFLFLFVTNREYVQPLFTTLIGRFMLISGLVLLVIGVIVLRRLVRPKY